MIAYSLDIEWFQGRECNKNEVHVGTLVFRPVFDVEQLENFVA